MLTVLMLTKFTYSHEHTFNPRNQDYEWKSSILSSKQIKNGSVQTNYAILKSLISFCCMCIVCIVLYCIALPGIWIVWESIDSSTTFTR